MAEPVQQEVSIDNQSKFLDDVREYINIGKDLFAEMKRNCFSVNECYAGVLCSRSEVFMEGLVIISRNPVWPQYLVDVIFDIIKSSSKCMTDTWSDLTDFNWMTPNISMHAKQDHFKEGEDPGALFLSGSWKVFVL